MKLYEIPLEAMDIEEQLAENYGELTPELAGRIEQFMELSEAEGGRLHGMGPRGVELIRRALAAKGLSFSD